MLVVASHHPSCRAAVEIRYLAERVGAFHINLSC